MRALSLPALRLVLSLLLVAPVVAQDAPVALVPGHPDLATDAVTLGDLRLTVAIVEPMTQPLGFITQGVTHHDDGTATVTTAVDIMTPGGADTIRDTMHVAWPSLAPLSQSSHDLDSGDLEEAAFDGLRVSGRFGDDGAEPLPFDLELGGPVFGPGGVGVLVRALPFREGYTATAPVFSAEQRLQHETLAVVGREDVAVGEATVSAWVVERTREDRTRRYFIHPDTRALLKMTFAPAPGYLVEMVPADD